MHQSISNAIKRSVILRSTRMMSRMMSTATDQVGITSLGITNPNTIHHNLTYDTLFEHEKKNDEGVVIKAKYGETFAVDTGKFTGRSPSDKWIVKNIGTESDENLWWGSVNQPLLPEVFDELYEKAINHLKIAVENNPSLDKPAALFFGHSYFGLKKLKLSLKYYKLALQENSEEFNIENGEILKLI